MVKLFKMKSEEITTQINHTFCKLTDNINEHILVQITKLVSKSTEDTNKKLVESNRIMQNINHQHKRELESMRKLPRKFRQLNSIKLEDRAVVGDQLMRATLKTTWKREN